MKKLILSLGIVTAASLAGFAQISGTSHDFSTGFGWNTTGEICVVCHTPHNALVGVADAPLWNHQVSAVLNYTLYTQAVSGTFDGTTTQPDGSSKLCLSCHDGTVGLGNFGGTTGNTNYMPGVFNVGTDLSNDHPISFVYDAALVALDGGNGLFEPTTTPSGIVGSTGTIQDDMLISNKMQCSSCHDVHNKYGVGTYLLVKDNAGSALCLTCHNK